MVLGGLVGHFLLGWLGESIVLLLPFAAGNFIYIASTDLIPEIRYKESTIHSLLRFFMFIGGIGIMAATRILAH
jgi:zinc and cadmium transporter